jgi:hypothetical protein
MNCIKEFFKGFKEGIESFVGNIKIIVNTVLLSIVYIIGIGLTSIFAKILGKHFLDMKLSTKQETYWSELGLKKKPADEYYKLF